MAMDKQQILDEVVTLVSEQVGVPLVEVTPEVTLKDLDADSLDEVELLMAFEERWHLDLGDDEEQLSTLSVKGIADLLCKHIEQVPSA